MSSNGSGLLYGRKEDGEEIPLSTPQPDVVVGPSLLYNRSGEYKDLEMEKAKKSLEERARIDTEKYYYLEDGRREQLGNTINYLFVIPYVTFLK